MTWAPLTKPAPGSGRVERKARKVEALRESTRDTRALKHAARRIEQDIRREVYDRDNARCRACGEALTFGGDLTEAMHAHHLVMRSAGGSDLAENRVALDWECHLLAHEHRLRIEGEPNGTLTFTTVNLETGEVLRQWEG